MAVEEGSVYAQRKLGVGCEKFVALREVAVGCGAHANYKLGGAYEDGHFDLEIDEEAAIIGTSWRRTEVMSKGSADLGNSTKKTCCCVANGFLSPTRRGRSNQAAGGGKTTAQSRREQIFNGNIFERALLENV